jgi:hypothetical protein
MCEGLSEDEIALRLVTLCRFGCKEDFSDAINVLNKAADRLLSQDSSGSKIAEVGSAGSRRVYCFITCALLYAALNYEHITLHK